MIEKADEIGGTWYANQYPGCACDIPSHLYSFSFDRNPDWSRMYSGRDEIQSYLKSCAQRFGVNPYIRVNTRMQEAVWDEAPSLWRVTTGDGAMIRARVLVSAVGALHVPRFPEIPGMEKFAGPSFHSTWWDASVPLEGKRVAVIGTGASAIQFVPEIAPKVAKLSRLPAHAAVDCPQAGLCHSRALEENAFAACPALTGSCAPCSSGCMRFASGDFWETAALRQRGDKMALDHLDCPGARP